MNKQEKKYGHHKIITENCKLETLLYNVYAIILLLNIILVLLIKKTNKIIS